MRASTCLPIGPVRDAADLDALLGYRLRRVSVAVMADLTASLAPLSLRPAEASMLFVIGAEPGITQSALGRRLGIQRANMAPLTGGLARRDLLERAPLDGRAQGLVLSGAGEALRQAAWAVTRAHEARVFADLTPGTQATLLATLQRVSARLDPAG